MTIEFEVSAIIPASPEDVYNDWLDSDGHSGMTGSPANVSNEPNAPFEAWDGYITGINLELEPGKRILQSWRTSEFESFEADSRLEITFESAEGGTQVTIRHSNLPPHGMQYKQGWVDAYFEPMKKYYFRSM